MSESVRVSEKKSETAQEKRTSHVQKSNYSLPVNSSVDRILFLQRTIGNRAVGRLVKERIINGLRILYEAAQLIGAYILNWNTAAAVSSGEELFYGNRRTLYRCSVAI